MVGSTDRRHSAADIDAVGLQPNGGADNDLGTDGKYWESDFSRPDRYYDGADQLGGAEIGLASPNAIGIGDHVSCTFSSVVATGQCS